MHLLNAHLWSIFISHAFYVYLLTVKGTWHRFC